MPLRAGMFHLAAAEPLLWQWARGFSYSVKLNKYGLPGCFNLSILSGMCTSVVFRLAFGLPRSADTELRALINKPKQNWKNVKDNGHRKHFYHVFQMGKNTLKCWQLLEQAEECLQHNDLENSCTVEWGGIRTMDSLQLFYCCNYNSTDHCGAIKWHSSTFISDNATLRCRDETREWEVNGPQNSLIRNHCQNETRN